MSYELREHTADVAVEATGGRLGETFAAVADGMAAAMCEEIPATGERLAVEVEAESLEALLFDYLDELIYRRDVENVLPVENTAGVIETADGYRISASARGVPLEGLGAREVKAVTYSEMVVEQTDGAWRAYVVLDV
jgi:SHS2 domain-containing protein